MRDRSLFFDIVVVALAAGGAALACASTQNASETPSPRPPSASTRSSVDEEVYGVFVSSDANAIARMGQHVEQERPPLSANLVERMFAFMTTDVDSGPPLQMLRPMLFRSVAVVVGAPAKPTLERCAAESERLRSLCQDTMAEISGAAR